MNTEILNGISAHGGCSFPDIAGLRPSCKGPGRHGDSAPLNLTLRNNGLQINGNFPGNLKLEGKAPTGGRGSGWE